MLASRIRRRGLARLQKRHPLVYSVTRGSFLLMRYRGCRYNCPVCATGLRRWRTTPGYRWRLVCPVCRSEARHRLIWLWLTEQSDILGRSRLLHISPEPALQRLLRGTPGLAYVSTDIQSPLVDFHSDLEALALPAESFDAIVCNHVLPYVRDDRKGMREMFRVLRPGAAAVVTTPFEPDIATDEALEGLSVQERLVRFGWSDSPLRRYGYDLSERLVEAGFTVRQYRYGEVLGPERAERYGLSMDEVIFLATRPSA